MSNLTTSIAPAPLTVLSGHTTLVRSIEPGENWIWCYVDQNMVGEAKG